MLQNRKKARQPAPGRPPPPPRSPPPPMNMTWMRKYDDDSFVFFFFGSDLSPRWTSGPYATFWNLEVFNTVEE